MDAFRQFGVWYRGHDIEICLALMAMWVAGNIGRFVDDWIHALFVLALLVAVNGIRQDLQD